MKQPAPPRQRQSGVLLLEALIAMLIFSIGVLSIVALYANAIKLSGDAKYRSDAALLANQLISQMWVGDRTPTVLNTNFAGSGGSGGAAYTAWLANVQATLPGADANPPSVTVDTSSAPSATTGRVVVTLFWKAPSESASAPAHTYVETAQIR